MILLVSEKLRKHFLATYALGGGVSGRVAIAVGIFKSVAIISLRIGAIWFALFSDKVTNPEGIT